MHWILLDIGNILWSDTQGDAFTLANIHEALAARDLAVSKAELAAAQARAVAEAAPSTWRAVIRHFCGEDEALRAAVFDEVRARWLSLDPDVYRAWTTPFPSSSALVAGLAADGHRLLLASNNEKRALVRLDELGLLRHFASREVSDTLGLAKPAPRFFEAILTGAGADPARSLMVGDRLGNDIAPARALGMKTLRLRHGSHARQEPRSDAERPDLTVDDPADLLAAARSMMHPGRSL